jgi:hypothetical protein
MCGAPHPGSKWASICSLPSPARLYADHLRRTSHNNCILIFLLLLSTTSSTSSTFTTQDEIHNFEPTRWIHYNKHRFPCSLSSKTLFPCIRISYIDPLPQPASLDKQQAESWVSAWVFLRYWDQFMDPVDEYPTGCVFDG